MAKNAELLLALRGLTLAASPQEQKKQLDALDALMRVNLDTAGDGPDPEATNGAGLFRKAVIEHKDIFPTVVDAATDKANAPTFLSGDGDGDPRISLETIQALAAQKRIELGLQQAQNSPNKQHILKALTAVGNQAEWRNALTSIQAKAIFGDLTTASGWEKLQDANFLAIIEVASGILTAPIKKKVEEAVAKIDALNVKVTAANAHIHDTAVGAIVPAQIAKAIDNFQQMLDAQEVLRQYRATHNETLDLPRNDAKKGEIDAIIAQNDGQVAAAKADLVAQEAKLGQVITDRKGKLDAAMANHTEESLTQAKQHYKTITDAIALIELSGGVVTPAQKTAKTDAEQDLIALTREVKKANITQMKDEFDRMGGPALAPTQTLEEKIKLVRDHHKKRADKLAEAEEQFAVLKEARDEAKRKADAAPGDPNLLAAYEAAKAAVGAARPEITAMRGQVNANIRVQVSGQVFNNHSFSNSDSKPKIVKKGTPLAPGVAPASSGPSLAQDNKVETYQGVYLADGYVARSTEWVLGNPLPGGRREPDREFTLEQDNTGKVTNVTPPPRHGQPPQQPTLYQASVEALRQAQMFLTNYDPKKGPIRIENCDKDTAERLHAAILLLKGDAKVDIRSIGKDPQKSIMQSSANDAFIEAKLDPAAIKEARKSMTPKVVNQQAKIREEIEQIRQGGKPGEAHEKGLKVGQVEKCNPTTGKLTR